MKFLKVAVECALFCALLVAGVILALRSPEQPKKPHVGSLRNELKQPGISQASAAKLEPTAGGNPAGSALPGRSN